MKGPRKKKNIRKKSNRFGGLKAPKNPVSVGEEYIVTIEEIGNKGIGVAKLRGHLILVNDTYPGDRVMVRITKTAPSSAAAVVIHKSGTQF